MIFFIYNILILTMLVILIHYTPPHLINSQDTSCKLAFTSQLENSVDPDQLASEKPADLDLHCFQNRIMDTCRFSMVEVNIWCFSLFVGYLGIGNLNVEDILDLF